MNTTTESDQSVEVVTETSQLESIERAQIDMQIATARKYPRVLSKVKEDMLTFATLDEETAAGCFYTLPRGGKTIQGPSIRLAEIAISSYTNLRAGARVIQVVATGDNPHVVIQAVAHDLEKNVAITIEKRRRITKKRNKLTVDEDDINLAANAGCAIALRDATFKVVPLALIKPVYEQAKRVAIGEATSLASKRDKIIERLKQMGARLENILGVVDARKVDDIDADKLGVLIGLGTALKDGETTVEEAFPAPKFDTDETIGSVLGEKKAEAKLKEQPPIDVKATPAPEPEKKPEPAKKTAAPKAEQQQTTTTAEEKPDPAVIDACENAMIDLEFGLTRSLKWAEENGHALGSKKNPQLKDLPAATVVAIHAMLVEKVKAKNASAG